MTIPSPFIRHGRNNTAMIETSGPVEKPPYPRDLAGVRAWSVRQRNSMDLHRFNRLNRNAGRDTLSYDHAYSVGLMMPHYPVPAMLGTVDITPFEVISWYSQITDDGHAGRALSSDWWLHNTE